MPIYVYKNLTTGERFEIEQRITEPPLEEHPATGDPVKRLIQPVGIAFKGSGFYATDSRSSKSAKPTATAESGTKESASSDGATAKTASSDGAASKPASSDSTTSSKTSSSDS